jgi:cell division protein FtsB
MIKPNRGRDWLNWRRKLLTAGQLAGLTTLLLMAGSLIFGEMGIPRYLGMRDHAQQLERELVQLQRLNGELRLDIDRVQYDPIRLEELARERLGYVRKGETVYQLAPLRESDEARR